MNIRYKGVQKELPPRLQAKLDVKFAKLSKLLERRGEKEAHVVLTNERHIHQAEITLQFYDHALVGIGRDADAFTAMCTAIDNLEKQAVKTRGKWREKARRGARPSGPAGAAEKARAAEPPTAQRKSVAARKAAAVQDGAQTKRVFRVNHQDQRKPMTIDEAMLEMENGGDYLVYRDAKKDGVSVLVRRKDGHFDLIEG
jgi:putative sigma-54 modulation protein